MKPKHSGDRGEQPPKTSASPFSLTLAVFSLIMSVLAFGSAISRLTVQPPLAAFEGERPSHGATIDASSEKTSPGNNDQESVSIEDAEAILNRIEMYQLSRMEQIRDFEKRLEESLTARHRSQLFQNPEP